jgi:putative ubiquitin-RnfH superfamily antitoxin RatB of RatAB toxin-antitoxin module
MGHAEQLTVEVAYAVPRRQLILALQVEDGTTAEQAIRASGILDEFPEIDLQHNRVGIFGKPCRLADTLRNGDRVEIYRPLIADPKEIRKQRAARGKDMKKGTGG